MNSLVGRRSRRALLVLLSVLLAASCVSNPDGGCPRGGLDSPRRCKRLCVVSSSKAGRPLPCTCAAECLCWKMSGHVRMEEPPEAAGEDPGSSSTGAR